MTHSYETFTTSETGPLPPQVFAETDVAGLYEIALEPNVPYDINSNFPIARDPAFGSIIARITTDRNGPDDNTDPDEQADSFVLIDVRKNQLAAGGKYKIFGDTLVSSDTQFMLIGKNYGSEQGGGSKGIRLGESVIVGRDDPVTKSRFDLNSWTSRKHFGITLDNEGKLNITDFGSSHGTHVRSAAMLHEPRQEQTKEEQIKAFSPPEQIKPVDPWEDLAPHLKTKLEGYRETYAAELQAGHIDENAIVQVIKNIDDMRARGSSEKAIRAAFYKSFHPDTANPDDPREKDMKTALFKILGDEFRP